MKLGSIKSLVGACVASLVMAGTAIAQEYSFRVTSFSPETSIHHKLMIAPFAENVERLTNGRVKIQIFEGGVLAPAFKFHSAVQDGVAEGGVGPAVVLGSSDPFNLIILTYPGGLAMDSLLPWLYFGGGEEMLTEHRRETMGLHSIVVGAGTTEFFAHSHVPLQNKDDFKGVKFRTLGHWAGILKDYFGAAPVVVPGPEVYGMLEKKGIDAAEYSSPALDLPLGLGNIAKYIVYPGIHGPSYAFEFVMKKETWDALPDDIKAAIHAAAKLTTYDSILQMTLADMKALEDYDASGNEIIRLSDELMNEIRADSRDWFNKVAKEAAEKGNPWPMKAAESIFAFQDMWQKNSYYLLTDHRTR